MTPGDRADLETVISRLHRALLEALTQADLPAWRTTIAQVASDLGPLTETLQTHATARRTEKAVPPTTQHLAGPTRQRPNPVAASPSSEKPALSGAWNQGGHRTRRR